MTRLAPALAALFLAAPAAADQIGPQVESWQAGAVCPASFTGNGSPAFVARTQTVPAVVGMGFGVRAQVNVPGGIPNVTIVVDHPPFAGGTRQTFPASLSGQGMSGFYYQFETQAEAAPGTWTVTAMLGSQVIYSLQFDVVAPRQGDGLLQACGVL